MTWRDSGRNACRSEDKGHDWAGPCVTRRLRAAPSTAWSDAEIDVLPKTVDLESAVGPTADRRLVRYSEQRELGCWCRRVPVKKVQQSVPAGAVQAVEPPVRPPSPWVPPAPTHPAASRPPPVPAEDPVEYPSEDGLPISTNTDHLEWMVRCYRELKHRFRGRQDLFIGCNMLIYYEPGNNKAAVAPDVFVSFGVPQRNQPSYFVWLEGKPPDVVWEFGAPLTVKGDAGEKKKTYRRMGVREYWLVDPVGGVYDPRVQGFELVDGAYERMSCEEGPDGFVAVWSPVLQLELRFADGRLRFWDRETARYRQLPEEEAEARIESIDRARREAEALRQEAEAQIESIDRARREAEAQIESDERALKAEKRARKALEARLAKFEAESRSTRDPT